MIREQIEEKLRAAFNPVFLEVVDESYRHNVPAGSESHFKVVLVSDRFTGERFLNRHRLIYSTLTEELSTTVHALALHTYTIKERAAGYGIRITALSGGRHHRLINRICNRRSFSSMLLTDFVKTAFGPFCFV